MKKLIRRVRLIIACFGIMAPHAVLGDGGLVQLREATGPFLVTIFVSAETLCGRPGDLSVLVQSRTNQEVVLDADVNLVFYPPVSVSTNESEPICGLSPLGAEVQLPDSPHGISSRATHQAASNKLLYASPVEFSVAGIWRLKVTVSSGPHHANFDCPISIASTPANPPGLWFCLAFPPLAIAVFALNQVLRKHSLENKGLKSIAREQTFARQRNLSASGLCGSF